MSRLIVPSRKLWTPPQRQRGYVVLDGYRGGGGGGGAWLQTTAWTADGSAIGWGGLTLRQKIPASAFASGSMIRLTLRAGTGAACVIGKAYIQQKAASGDAYDFASTPVQLLFSGSAGVSIAAATELVTDPLSFSVDDSKDHVVSMYITSGDTARKSTLSGWSSYYKTGDDAATVNATGYSSSSFAANLIRKIEVFQP